jgi:hypothetical protein
MPKESAVPVSDLEIMRASTPRSPIAISRPSVLPFTRSS